MEGIRILRLKRVLENLLNILIENKSSVLVNSLNSKNNIKLLRVSIMQTSILVSLPKMLKRMLVIINC